MARTSLFRPPASQPASPPAFANLITNIIGTNLLAKFHEDRKIHVALRVLKRKNAPPPGSHVCQPTGIIFEHVQDIIGMNLLTKFHKDRTVNVASRDKGPTPWKPYQSSDQIHEDWTINVASSVLTRFYYSHIWKNAPPLGSPDFQANLTIFKLIQDINKTNLLTIFHEDRTINVASRVLTRKNAPPPGGHNLLTKFHEDQTISVVSRVKNAPPLGSHTNLKTKLHEDWTINVASRELTRQTNDGQKTITKAHHEHAVLR
ncbi:hypothetical protein DPMN_070330 [Dreissena polymorpha]|uniref:Uncharacterized protein n=1 Tax=Dreissena polymorpha TaxID=45954 RepID=A0A9D3Z0S7_DREPO|nr:hypothetical protein DPMN_070330 [Dreissena polymorpha]